MTKTKITSPNKGSAKRTKKIKSPAPEKRLKRFRSKPTIAIGSRIERAIQQRLFLVEVSSSTTCPHHGGPSITLNVLGSTGNVYEVTISKIPRCNCPDHTRGNLCKHLLFVMLKVVGLPVNSALVYQSAYLTNELDEILAMLQARTLRLGRDVVANEAVRQRHTDMKNGESADAVDSGTSLVQRKEVEGIDCPICFEELGTDLSQLTYCQQTCGTNFHSGCMQMWIGQAAQRDDPTCPNCRQPWMDKKAIAHDRKKDGRQNQDEGYQNLGNLQGQSLVRDTSTYHSYDWHDSYKRRRRY